MTTLFKKIRRQLLRENRFTRYLLYGIGEIILVVIGILIALQINNWNNAQNTRQTEIEMLQDIRNALMTDLNNTIDENIKECKIRITVTKAFLDMHHKEIPLPDSIPKYAIKLGLFKSFHPVVSPYKLLESKGLDLISNKSLKYKIINLYTLEYTYIDALFSNQLNNLRDVVRPEIREHFKINPPEFEVRYQPLSVEASVKDHDFMNMITIMYANNNASLIAFEKVSKSIKDIILSIDEEIMSKTE